MLMQQDPFAPAKQNGHVLTLVSDLSDDGNKPFPKWGICVCVFTPRKASAPSSLSPKKPLSVHANLASFCPCHDTDYGKKKCIYVTQFRHTVAASRNLLSHPNTYNHTLKGLHLN